MNAITKRLAKSALKSGHDGKFKTLKKHVVFSDGTHVKKSAIIRILGVGMLYAKVQLTGVFRFQTARISHAAVNW